MPVSMMKAGTPEQIKALVKDLIDDVGRDGGYILATSAPMYDANPENVRTFVETGREYGARSRRGCRRATPKPFVDGENGPLRLWAPTCEMRQPRRP